MAKQPAPLKLVIDKLEDVDEPLRGLYVAGDDGVIRLNADLPDTTALEGTLRTERQQRKDAEKAVKAFKELGLSVDEVKALVAANEEATRKKASAAGDFKALEE